MFEKLTYEELEQRVRDLEKAEDALKKNRERMELALKGADLGMWDYYILSGELIFDERSIELIGANPKNDAEMDALIHPDDLKPFDDAWDAVMEGREVSYILEYRIKNPSGQYKWLMDKGNVVERDSNGEPTRATGILQDITKRKQAEDALRKSEERLGTLLHSLPVGIIFVDAETHEIVDANPKASLMIEAPIEHFIGSQCHNYLICPAENGKCPITNLGQSVDNSECELLNANGESIPILKTVIPVQIGNRELLIECFVDITDQKRLENELRELATVDELTAIWNRRFFLEQANRQIKVQSRSGRPVAVLMIDVDLFFQVNDRFGHNIGDKALKTVSKACSDALRETDLFGRLGGEEFAALLVDCNPNKAMQVAERLRHAVSMAEVPTPNENLFLTISIGVSSSNSKLGLEKLIIDADQALYKAKETGRNRVCTLPQ